MDELIEHAVTEDAFRLTPDVVRELQRIAVEGLEETAGQLRQEQISIVGSAHVPPIWQDVDRYLRWMCDYVNDRWEVASADHLAAYVMWRINWIHPFTNGNGRTARAISYLVYCAKLGFNLPGERTIPEVIDRDRQAYYAALEDADIRWRNRDTSLPLEQQIDVSVMERLILDALEVQLATVEAPEDDA